MSVIHTPSPLRGWTNRAPVAYTGGSASATKALASLKAEPGNDEIRRALEAIKKRVGDQRQQMLLQQQARTGILFELANQAFESGDQARAKRILDEILRLGPYQPAESLKKRMSAQAVKKPAPKPVAATGRPSPSSDDIARAENFYYEALRRYAENDLEGAIRQLHAATALNPDSEVLKNSLETIQKEFQRRRSIKP
jgi:tetratricopeptide (TPR) repeat protein